MFYRQWNRGTERSLQSYSSSLMFKLRQPDSKPQPWTSMLFNVICTLTVILIKYFIQQFPMEAVLALHLWECVKSHPLNFISVNKQLLWRHQDKQGDRWRAEKDKVYLDLIVFQAFSREGLSYSLIQSDQLPFPVLKAWLTIRRKWVLQHFMPPMIPFINQIMR